MPYHWAQPSLAEEAILEAGHYGRAVRAAGQRHRNALRESVLEDIRLNHFPFMPSRLSSSFFFHTRDQAAQYADVKEIRSLDLYEVELVDADVVVADVDFRRVNPTGPFGLDWARAYWCGDLMPPVGNDHLFRQRFAASNLRVLRRLPV